MRFIGNKEKLLDKIYQAVLLTKVNNGVFCDFFAGTSSVGRFFKEKGYKIISSDILYFSYVLQKAYIDNNEYPKFKKLSKSYSLESFESVRKYLNSLKGVKGFIYKNYTEEGTKNQQYKRMYFTPENGRIIDAIRTQIEEWKNKKLISEKEYFILLAAVIESVPFYSNISGVYGAFLKQYDPRALKRFEIKPIKIYHGSKKNIVYNKNSMNLINNLHVDILYLDPPYNSRQYAPNYHLLETIAKYDKPKIKGVAGLRDYANQKSDFCNKKTALIALDKIAKKTKYKYLILSFSSEGIMPEKNIISVLEKYGKVTIKNINYPRYKSNSNGESKNKKIIQEKLYILRR